MRELPKGWAWVSIADIKGASGLITDGDWILAKEFLTGDDTRLIQLGDIGEGYFLDKSSKRIASKRANELNCTFLLEGDILISRMAHPLARACQLPNLPYECITAVDVTILRPDNNYFDNKYVTWLFNDVEVRQQAEYLSSGTTRKRISRKKLEAILVPIPPLPEQHRIVTKLDSLFSHIDATVTSLKEVQAQVKQYRQSVLRDAFNGELTREWREEHKKELEPALVLLERIKEERKKELGTKYKELPPVDASELGELPEGWEWVSVSNFRGVSGLITDGDWILSKEFLTGDDTRLIQLGDIGEGYFLDKTSKLISNKRAKELNCTFLLENDILVSRMAHPLARACQLPNLPYECITAVDVTVLRPDKKYFSNGYIMWLFNSGLVMQQAEVLSSGTTRKRISRKNLEVLSVPLPSFVEQELIADEIETCFDVADQVERAVEQGLKQAEILRQSILKQAFGGKLVPQDPDDEPASVLLEKIRAKKEETKK